MKLNIAERFMVLGMLPKESNFATLKIVRQLQESLSLTEEEFKDFDVKQEGQQIQWNKKGTEEKEIEIGEKATDIIIEALKKLNDNNKLTPQHISLYEKFIWGKLYEIIKQHSRHLSCKIYIYRASSRYW